MRRRLRLFISDQEVDLSDESFILFNYTMEDLTNPTIVKNSFTKQITLKGTAKNNRVFGSFYRNDRITQISEGYTGVNFDASRKTPFTIYNEMNEIVEEGYMKLDNVVTKEGGVEYSITLYGGLGSFLYSLAYDNEGNKRSLADLKYTGEGAGDDELNFQINSAAIRSAWARLNGDESAPALWDILNFAPCYNGIPSGSFDADKAIIATSAGSLAIPSGYNNYYGVALANLAKKYTEWEMKEVRSYLQRPVIKFSKILEAIAQPYNNGGYEVSFDPNFKRDAYYEKTWLTLPILNELEVTQEMQRVEFMPGSGVWFQLPNGGDMNKEYNVHVIFKPNLTYSGQAPGALYLGHTYRYTPTSARPLGYYQVNRAIIYRFIAYDANNNEVATTFKRVFSIRPDDYNSQTDIIGSFDANGKWVGVSPAIDIEGVGIDRIAVSYSTSMFVTGDPVTVTGLENALWVTTASNNTTPTTYTATGYGYEYTENSYYEYLGASTGRSNVLITKSNLLSTEKTPADYLLSFCKALGLVMRSEKGEKRIIITPRWTFYRGDLNVSLSERINELHPRKVTPFMYNARWYEWANAQGKGEFLDYYKNVYGSEFGTQRVNTGYEFDANTFKVTDSILFREAAQVLESNRHFIDVYLNGKLTPSIYADGGTYQLFNSEGETEEFPFPSIKLGASIAWNSEFNGYDLFAKPQFHEKENKSVDSRDVLLFFDKMQDSSAIGLRFTDDEASMAALNNNTPCWYFSALTSENEVTMMPIFSRYIINETKVVTKSLDFGYPKELAIPDITFGINSSIYDESWDNYIHDRYDTDSRVLVCRVNLAGMIVDENLFRQFYYFDNCIWVLNRIINYSLTTYDDVECEFVRVQDKNNYTNRIRA